MNENKTQLLVVSFTKEVDPQLAKRPMIVNGRLANRGLSSVIKEATGIHLNDQAECYDTTLWGTQQRKRGPRWKHIC